MFQRSPGNVEEESGECSRRFRGMFEDNPENNQEDSGECSRRFRGMLQGYQKTLNKPQLRGLNNTLHRVGTINLKLEN